MFGSLMVSVMVLGSQPDPLYLYRASKIQNAKLIMEYASKKSQDPYELLAISITESNLNPKALSNKGAIGLFQVMCKYWFKQNGYKSVVHCEKQLYKPTHNIRAGILVLTTVRKKYKQCKKNLAYRCYFAGQGWKKYRGKTKKSIIRYENKIKERKEILKTHYSAFIEDYMHQIKDRS